MASPRRWEPRARQRSMRSVSHGAPTTFWRDAAYRFGRLSELRTSSTFPTIFASTQRAGGTQALTRREWQEPLIITWSRKSWARRLKHNQALVKVLYFRPNQPLATRTEYQRARRAALACSPRCVASRRTNFSSRLFVHPYRANTQMDRQIRTTEAETSVEAARNVSGNGIVAIATVTLSVRVCPSDFPEAAFPIGLLHRILVGPYGITLGASWSPDAVTADYLKKSVSEYFLAALALRTRDGIGWPAFDLVSNQESTHVRLISNHLQNSNLFRSSVTLGEQGSPSGCVPIDCRAL